MDRDNRVTGIAEHIAHLNAELDRDEFDIHRFDQLLAELFALREPSIIQPLLGIFRDEFLYQEAFWSVLHAIEGFDVEDYLDELIAAISSQKKVSNVWLRLLVSRIANDPVSHDAFLNKATQLDNLEKRSVLYNAVFTATENLETENIKKLKLGLGVLSRVD